jgi:hypothetical protein
MCHGQGMKLTCNHLRLCHSLLLYFHKTNTSHDILGIGNVKTLFGTAPSFWNALLGAMAQLPSSWLSNEAVMEKLAIFSLPIVRLVDYFAGATNAMRVDVSCQKDPTVQEMALYGMYCCCCC